jgi:hypothetical protein
MTDEEREVWGLHFERFQRLLAEGVIVLVGPTLGRLRSSPADNARGELRPFRVSLLRGGDERA